MKRTDTFDALAAVLWLGLAAAGTALRLGRLDMETLEALPLCAFKFATGLDCPGCGMGHALLAAFGGDFAQAHAHHPLGLALLALWTAWLIPPFRNRLKKMSPPRAAGPAALCVILAVYAMKLLA